MSLITYHIVSDQQGKLRSAAKLSCNFWNRFILPESPIVIRLGTFTQWGTTIARAYYPYRQNGTVYGVIEFNTNYLSQFSENEIVGTIIHEIGHTLGMGWDAWMTLFSHSTGCFYKRFIKKLPALAKMRVETDYGPGTTLAHWDEQRHDEELMTGFKDSAEHVLPITIEVMVLLGHEVIEKLGRKRPLEEVLDELRAVMFLRVEDAEKLNREAFVKTHIWEEIYTDKRTSFK
jgi:hypothetical protein